MQIPVEFPQTHPVIHQLRVAYEVKVVLPEIHDPPAGSVGDVRMPDRPFIRDRPVEGLSARWHFVSLKSWEQLSEVFKCLPNPRTGEAPANRKEVLCLGNIMLPVMSISAFTI